MVCVACFGIFLSVFEWFWLGLVCFFLVSVF